MANTSNASDKRSTMQNNSRIAFIISILLLSFYSCKKENISTSSNFQFNVKIDGIMLTADSAEGFLHIDTSTNFTQRTFMVFGFFHKKTITEFFTDTVKSFHLINTNYAGWGGKILGMTDSISGEVYGSNSAIFNITYNDTVNKMVSGNFSGYVLDSTSTDSILISNGIFKNVKYSF